MLSTPIAQYQVGIHSFVIAELACRSLPNRKKTLTCLDQLIALPVVREADVRMIIGARSLRAKGIDLTDAPLIASSLATPGTQPVDHRDGHLRRVADSIGIRAQLP